MELVILIIYIGIIVGVIAGMWKAFVKAGQPGWAVLVPIYNIYVMTQIAKKPGWWVLLMLIPIVSIVIMFILMIEIAKNFGKDTGFGIGLALLGFVFWPILGFGDAQYIGAEKPEDMEILDA
jgi:uncharacterized membrane protein YhaH (DUF805 family)